MQVTDDQTYRPLKWATVVVSHPESQAPPEVAPLPSGGRDLRERSRYFSSRRDQYVDAAREACHRFLSRCKHDLFLPLPSAVPVAGLDNPTWTDEAGTEYESGILTLAGTFHMCGEEHAFDVNRANEIPSYCATAHEPSLQTRVLSDAINAWNATHLRRSLIDAASACEIGVKTKLYTTGEPAASVFEYMENAGSIRMTIPEMISRVCEYAVGHNFKAEHPQDFENIDMLFRARNKAVHRGQLECRADDGSVITVDKALMRKWLRSVTRLFGWIEGL
jgi:hypothetical protein